MSRRDEVAELLRHDRSQLWGAAVAEDHAEPDFALMDVGLRLEPLDEARGWDYGSTPDDAVTFASTGGDGVHFSGIIAPDAQLAVVMTVPMQFDRPNVIVGRSIREFLCLGCVHSGGYFTLEQLAYDWDATTSQLEAKAATSVPADDSTEMLARVRARLHLSPWRDVRTRLATLQTLVPA